MSNRTIVYVDGFNFYRGAVRDTSWRWLDLVAFSEAILPRGDQLELVRYFTAIVNDQPDDPQQSQRQNDYVRALEAHCGEMLSVHLGKFVTRNKKVRYRGEEIRAKVPEEKGSDASLAAHLIFDALRAAVSKAVVVSNDSDLQPAVDLAVSRCGLDVVVVNPRRHKGQAAALKGNGELHIHGRHLKQSQLPDSVPAGGGKKTYDKPERWSAPRRGSVSGQN